MANIFEKIILEELQTKCLKKSSFKDSKDILTRPVRETMVSWQSLCPKYNPPVNHFRGHPS